MAGQQTLNLYVEVRLLHPQLKKHSHGCFFLFLMERPGFGKVIIILGCDPMIALQTPLFLADAYIPKLYFCVANFIAGMISD